MKQEQILNDKNALYEKIGNARVYHWDIEPEEVIRVNDYMNALLTTLLDEGEGFSGKRPLGNSSWESALPKALAFAGIVDYERCGDPEDEDDYDQSTWEIAYDNDRADKLIREYINFVFKNKDKK